MSKKGEKNTFMSFYRINFDIFTKSFKTFCVKKKNNFDILERQVLCFN